MKPKLVVLFADGWDDAALAGVRALRDEFDIVREGFDLFRFPENASILWFDVRRWIARLARRYRRAGVAGVLSTNEQYGALVAATLARELGLPGSDPAAIIRAQHKYYARRAMARALPDANPAYALLPYAFGRTSVDDREPALPYPFFVKPVKAAYSVLARRVDHRDDLQAHLTFHPWETHIIRRLVRPFGDLMKEHREFSVDPENMLAESLLDGVQINVDGWMDRGRIGFFGIVDSVMYPGTQAFARFEYPSRLPAAAQTAAYSLAEQAMRAVGFDHGGFNIEFYWDPDNGSFRVIEINPRLAGGLADLYERVDGRNPYCVLADLSVGRAPQWVRGEGRFAAATSFLFREFDGAVKIAPDRAQIEWLSDHYPDAALQTFIKRGNSRWREMKWLGSYRYAALSLGGTSREDVEQRFQDVCRNVSFERGATVRFESSLDTLKVTSPRP